MQHCYTSADTHTHVVSKVAPLQRCESLAARICEWTQALDERVLSLGVKPAGDQRDMQAVNRQAYSITPTITEDSLCRLQSRNLWSHPAGFNVLSEVS